MTAPGFEFEVADQIGDYELLAPLGEGGMGVVHLARGRDGRRVALKLLRPHVVGDREARERLAREVASLSRVRSPRVAEILDADPYAPVPYVVTRYVPGLPLHEHVREQGVLDARDLRHLGAGLAEALAAVHRVGVLHRDVKPANVLVEGRSPVLIDFGLARMADDPRLTATGWLLGTPGYLAPEILYGEEPTTASDVHAWAATLVFAATGRPPAGRGPAMAIMDRVRRGEFDLSGVPAPLLGVLRAALDADPLARPTVADLLHTLGGATPPAPAPEPLVDVEPTRVLQPAAPTSWLEGALRADDEADDDAFGLDGPPLDRPRVVRHRMGLLGVGLAGAGLVAWAPYVGAGVLAVLVVLLRFASVTAQRHTDRQVARGRARWWDVPASTLATPAYLGFSLVGTGLLLGWALATVAAVVFVLTALAVPLGGGLAVVGVVYVVCLWWGPASGRVRERARRLTARMARPTRTGPLVLLLGAAVAAALLVAVQADGPVWLPAGSAPWSDGWLAQLRDVLR